MGNVTTLLITDGAVTPANVNFEPTRVEDNLVTYHEKSSGVFLGFPSISFGNRLPNAQNGNYKATARLRIPVLETAATAASGFTPGPTLAYTLSANVDVVIPGRASAVERDQLADQLSDLMTQVDWLAMLNDMSLPY